MCHPDKTALDHEEHRTPEAPTCGSQGSSRKAVCQPEAQLCQSHPAEQSSPAMMPCRLAVGESPRVLAIRIRRRRTPSLPHSFKKQEQFCDAVFLVGSLSCSCRCHWLNSAPLLAPVRVPAPRPRGSQPPSLGFLWHRHTDVSTLLQHPATVLSAVTPKYAWDALPLGV